MKSLILLLYAVVFSHFSIKAQDVAYLVTEGNQLRKQMKDAEALEKYMEAVKLAPNDVPALIRCSEMHSILGNREKSKSKKEEMFQAGESYAETALKLEPQNADANFVMSMAMGRMALISSGRDKIKNVKDIKKYAEAAIATDPRHAAAHLVLGKWNYEVYMLNFAEKAAIKVIFGGLPQASLPVAILHMEKAREIDPGFIFSYLELAKAYKANGQSDKSIELLNRLLKLPPRTADDAGYKVEAKKMLEGLL